MQISPKPIVVKKLKEMAAKEGISLNALITPFLNDIASGKLTRGCCYVEPQNK
jgi:predicted HicB family RNase H-like nuclease